MLMLPSDRTPTPCRERERRCLEIIEARDAKLARKTKRIEKLSLRIDQAREVITARDATIAGREQTILENAGVIVEKDAIIARLAEGVEHLRSDNAIALSTLGQQAAHVSELVLKIDVAEEQREVRPPSALLRA